ncbi:protein NRT1/ PTR FAMILY 8.1-like [Zingiber officinale]|uniref:protein NRT1/ PTR FAMILY 8.1-like n=1 Tax=Zingiber officinale TaxID=94328 RepID=UPI001C4CD7E4|nr:protein NRT1/ PTR FAMILY 8.1-like [Zingiber officinale]
MRSANNGEEPYTKDGTVDFHGNPAVKKSSGNWRACPYILANECCERLAYYGMSTNLVNYMKDRLHQGNAAAAKNVSNWSGTCYVMPLLGAFVADAYAGRYWTISSFMIVYIMGLSLLTLTASVRGLEPRCHGGVCDATRSQTAAVFAALYLIALGTGGIKPCVSSFGADQFDESDASEKKRKTSFFNWFYFSINIGSLVASSVLVWVQTDVGWGWGFGIPAAAMALAVGSFFLGTPLYRHQRPGGSPITRVAQVIVAALRKIRVEVPEDKSLLHETAREASAIRGSRKLDHTDQFEFLDRAAVETAGDEATKDGQANPWRLCTVTQVEELKSLVRLLPVWASGIVFSAVYSQMGTMFVLQGNTLDRRLGRGFQIPSASLSLFDTLSVIAWVPVYDRLVVPIARRFTGRERGFTQLTRMGVGLVISIFAMLAAGVLELTRLSAVKRYGLYDDGGGGAVPVSVFWQVPQYFIVGAAEVFTFIGQLEFFYDQAPDAMRSMCSALSLTTTALGNYLSAFLVTIVTGITTKNENLGWIPDNLNRGHLDYFFWLLAILSLLNFGAYLFIAKWYTYKKTTEQSR